MKPNQIEALNDLAIGTQILVQEKVLDGFGHVSIRSLENPEHYFMLRDNTVVEINEASFIELDRDSNAVSNNGIRPSLERFIHGELYRARPEVMAVVHTHSPALIPFGASGATLMPLYHMCGFLSQGAPVFDISVDHGATNMLVTDEKKGASLVRSMGQSSIVLMRGHGATLIGSSVKEAVYRAIYASINASLQPVAMQLGSPKYLSVEEARLADELHSMVLDRPWDYWKGKLGA